MMVLRQYNSSDFYSVLSLCFYYLLGSILQILISPNGSNTVKKLISKYSYKV